MRRITPSVIQFIEEYDDMAKYPHTAKPYRERSLRFRAFTRVFESAQHEIAQLAKRGKV